MAARRRLTKRQLKQDKFVTTTFEVTAYLRQHQNSVIIASVCVVLAILASIYYKNYMSNQETQAVEFFLSGKKSYQAGNYRLAISDFGQIAERYSSGSYYDDALFYLGNGHYNIGEFDNAKKYIEELIDKFENDSSYYYDGLVLMSVIYEEMGENTEAAETYLRAAEQSELDYQKVDLILQAARVYQAAGERTLALEQYEKVLAAFPKSNRVQEAKMYKAELSAKGVS